MSVKPPASEHNPKFAASGYEAIYLGAFLQVGCVPDGSAYVVSLEHVSASHEGFISIKRTRDYKQIGLVPSFPVAEAKHALVRANLAGVVEQPVVEEAVVPVAFIDDPRGEPLFDCLYEPAQPVQPAQLVQPAQPEPALLPEILPRGGAQVPDQPPVAIQAAREEGVNWWQPRKGSTRPGDIHPTLWSQHGPSQRKAEVDRRALAEPVANAPPALPPALSVINLLVLLLPSLLLVHKLLP